MVEQDTEQAVETEAPVEMSENAVGADQTVEADVEEAESTEPAPGDADGEAVPESPDDGEENGTAGAKYDFTRPWTISNKFHSNLQSISEAFANQLSFSMSSYLRSTVDVSFRSVKQELFKDYCNRLPASKCIGVFSFEPLKGQSVITVDGNLMFVIMDKLIGGVGKLHEVDRDFTEIETKVFMLVLNKILGDLQDAAKKFFHAGVNLARIENNSAFIAVVTSGEKVIVTSLEMTIGDTTGEILLAIPMISFTPVMQSLDPKDEDLLDNSDIPAEDRAKIESALTGSSVDVVAEVGSARITLEGLLALEVGDTVMLERRMNEPIAVRVGKTTVCYGEPGRSQNRKAVRVVTKSAMEV